MQHLPTFFLFQFTPLREGRPACRSTILSGAPIFQFTPLREGRPALLPIPVAAIQISIHAPPRGATRSGCACSVVGGIFQFTPLREGRPEVLDGFLRLLLFQFTPLREGRPELRIVKQRTYAFQFTPLREGRRLLLVGITGIKIFQFTPLREGRPCIVAGRSCTKPNFNSRPSARGDTRHAAQAAVFPISIHAPPRGATRHRVHVLVGGQFQFTPLREGRPEVLDGFLRLLLFQFTPLREGRPELRIVKQRTYAFQFTPLREGRRLLLVGITGIKIFQFTPLREGRPCIVAGRSCTKPNFNSRPSARGDAIASVLWMLFGISIHAPPRGATVGRALDMPTCSFQFTPLREGRPHREILSRR